MIDSKTYETISDNQYLRCVYSRLGSLPISRSKSDEEGCIKKIKHSKYGNSKQPLSSSVIIEIKPCSEVKKLQIRKNAMPFAKNRKILNVSGKDTGRQSNTPFLSRKQKEKEIMEMKLKQLKQKNSIAFQLEQNINKWLIIQQIQTDAINKKQQNNQPPAKEQNSQYKNQQNNSKIKHKTQISLKESKIKKIENILSDYQCKKFLSQTKKGVKCNNKIKSRIYHTSANLSSITKLRVQSCSITKLEKKDNPSETKIIGNKGINRNKERVFSLNNSNVNSWVSQQQNKLNRDSMFLKAESEQNCLKCVKIDLGFKSHWRPQTAVFKQSKFRERVKTGKGPGNRGSLTHQATGWQNLGDSFQRQIYF